MGLDNIPRNYPCKTQGTAVLEPRLDQDGNPSLNDDGTPRLSINCQATSECGGCTWKNDYEASGLNGGSVTGMFGTDCWYRGKYGNWLLAEMGYDSDDLSFYGDNEDGTEKSVESCKTLSETIVETLDENEHNLDADGVKDALYAAWWLNWVAEKADGSTCWY